MADPTADMRAALAEAVAESEFPTDEKLETDSWEDWDKQQEPAAVAGETEEPGKEEAPVTEGAPETTTVEQEPLPDVYWGVNLEGIPDDAKRSIIDHFAQQDSTIQKLQARLAKEPEPAPAPEGVLEQEDITDEALLVAMGFDPEDWETQQLAPKLLPLARTIVDLEGKVEQLVEKDTVETVKTEWNRQLDELEEASGKLPFDRVQVLRYAIEENISNPYEVYFRLSSPVKKEVEQVVAKARRDAARKAEAGGVKPRTSGSTAPVIDLKTTSLRDAVAIAMKESEAETGLSFKNIFGRKAKVNE